MSFQLGYHYHSPTSEMSSPLPSRTTQGGALSVLVILSIISLTILIEPCSAFEDHDHDFHDESHEGGHDSKATNDLNLPKDKILLRTLETLTFTRHKRTTSRRTHSIHQLSCVGGTAGCKLFTPNVVECRNGGVDKSTGKQQWKCHAEMSERVKFNHVEVTCEGYDYPEDDYILLGSCGLEFTLDYVDPHDFHDQSYFKHMDDHEKDMHHDRVRAQHGRDQPDQPAIWFVRTLTSITSNLIGGSYILISAILSLLILATVVRYFVTTGNRRNRPILAAAATGGGRGRGYGPLSSPTAGATKKAC